MLDLLSGDKFLSFYASLHRNFAAVRQAEKELQKFDKTFIHCYDIQADK